MMTATRPIALPFAHVHGVIIIIVIIALLFFPFYSICIKQLQRHTPKTDILANCSHLGHWLEMALKGLILFCFLLALHKNFLELQCSESEPAEQQPTQGLGLSSVIRSLRRPGFMGLNLITRPVCNINIDY